MDEMDERQMNRRQLNRRHEKEKQATGGSAEDLHQPQTSHRVPSRPGQRCDTATASSSCSPSLFHVLWPGDARSQSHLLSRTA